MHGTTSAGTMSASDGGESKTANVVHESASDARDAIFNAATVIAEPNGVVEVRILGTKKGTVSGYFDDMAKLADQVARWNGRASVYVTLNPVIPDLLARANNRLREFTKEAVADGDIVRRRWLPLDFDPVRPSGISSTNDEHRAALDLAVQVRRWLRQQEWPDGIGADSGNGAHLLYRIDLPNDEDSRDLVERVIRSVAFQFSDDTVSVDLTTSNSARIWKLYGTVACKGDSTPDRPHRTARMMHVPTALCVVTREQLERVAGLLPSIKAEKQAGGSRKPDGEFDLERWIVEHNLPVRSSGAWNGGRKYILSPCPWNSAHDNGAAYILQFPSGAIAAGCHHNGCQGKGWADLREIYDGPHTHPTSSNSNRPNGTGDPSTQKVQPAIAASAAAPAPWSDPLPLAQVSLPPFPTNALPAGLREYVESLAQATQTPAGLAAMMTLAVIAASVQGRVEVDAVQWCEPLALWTVTVLPPGSRTTSVVAAAIAPILEYQREVECTREAERKLTRALKGAAEKRLDHAQQALAKRKPDDDQVGLLRSEVEAAVREIEALRLEPTFRLVTDDCTPEKLALLMQDNEERMCILSAEGGVFSLIGGRYSNKVPNLDIYLKGHAGDSASVDRVGRDAVHLAHPALSMGVRIQPDVLREIASCREFMGRGLVARFLWCLPDNNVGYRSTGRQVPAMPRERAMQYRGCVRQLLGLQPAIDGDGNHTPHLLRLDEAAWQLFEDLHARAEAMMRPDGLLAHMTDWGSKLHGQTLRIAGLLHLWQHVGAPNPGAYAISADTMLSAIRIMECLMHHARAAYGQMQADPATEDARAVLGWIVRSRTASFTRRDAHRALQARFEHSADLASPLAILEDRQYIRPMYVDGRTRPGRPASKSYAVNPATFRMAGESMTELTDTPNGTECVNSVTALIRPPSEAYPAERNEWEEGDV